MFNRWGKKLYEFTGPKGSREGLALVPEGTYFYFLKVTGFDNAKIEKNGL